MEVSNQEYTATKTSNRYGNTSGYNALSVYESLKTSHLRRDHYRCCLQSCEMITRRRWAWVCRFRNSYCVKMRLLILQPSCSRTSKGTVKVFSDCVTEYVACRLMALGKGNTKHGKPEVLRRLGGKLLVRVNCWIQISKLSEFLVFCDVITNHQ